MPRALILLTALGRAVRDWRVAVSLVLFVLVAIAVGLAFSANLAVVPTSVSSRRVLMSLCLGSFAMTSMMCLQLVPRTSSLQGRYVRSIRPMLQRVITIATIVVAAICLPAGLLALTIFTLSPSPFPNVAFVLLAALVGGQFLSCLGVLAPFIGQTLALLAEGTNA